ncbi:hypothetical protein AA18889_0115 [Acetobacter senegalensis DSM 18889]|nr:hypothetical protein AA18889_0115 [Acetobacter senegalensis DSM 18889]
MCAGYGSAPHTNWQHLSEKCDGPDWYQNPQWRLSVRYAQPKHGGQNLPTLCRLAQPLLPEQLKPTKEKT